MLHTATGFGRSTSTDLVPTLAHWNEVWVNLCTINLTNTLGEVLFWYYWGVSCGWRPVQSQPVLSPDSKKGGPPACKLPGHCHQQQPGPAPPVFHNDALLVGLHHPGHSAE